MGSADVVQNEACLDDAHLFLKVARNKDFERALQTLAMRFRNKEANRFVHAGISTT